MTTDARIALPIIVEPHELQARLNHPAVRIVDLCDRAQYLKGHVPGALHLEYGRLLRKEPPALGLLPDARTLEGILSDLGLSPGMHVVAYDDSGGGKASRLLWTLEAIGHGHYSLLNGGIGAWMAAELPVEPGPGPQPAASTYPVHLPQLPPGFADRDFLLDNLGREDLALLDARSPGEFRGEDVRASRGGHIPGAVNLEWTRTLNSASHNRLRPSEELRGMMETLGVTPDKEVVTYCQTHHRSSLLWLVLRALGYQRVRGYAGSWSEWGNDPEAPVEAGDITSP